MTIILVQHPTTVPRLGRLAATDSRDARYRMAAPPVERTFRSHLVPGAPFDQGFTSECVIYSGNAYLRALPVSNKIIVPTTPFYREVQRNDEWDGEDYEGTSVRALFKTYKNMGLVESYGWGDEAAMVARHILAYSPVVFGFDWTEQMFEPDANGYIWPRGRIVGGHAVLGVVCNLRRPNPDDTLGAIQILTSWGPWGPNGKGRAWLTLDSVQTLLDGLSGWKGEACTSIEVKRTQ